MSIYYVAMTGDDAHNGSFAAPFKTIGQASKIAAAGDTIQITAGTYYETISPPRDGLTYNGDRGPNGEWLTIIDPSSDVTGGWNQVTGAWVVGNLNLWQKHFDYPARDLHPRREVHRMRWPGPHGGARAQLRVFAWVSTPLQPRGGRRFPARPRAPRPGGRDHRQ